MRLSNQHMSYVCYYGRTSLQVAQSL